MWYEESGYRKEGKNDDEATKHISRDGSFGAGCGRAARHSSDCSTSGREGDNLDQAITNAKTPADHGAIAAYYDQEAAETKKKADLHRRAAESYRKMNIDKPVGMASMCDGIAAMWDKIAADNSKLAKAHQEMAKKAGAQTGQ